MDLKIINLSKAAITTVLASPLLLGLFFCVLALIFHFFLNPYNPQIWQAILHTWNQHTIFNPFEPAGPPAFWISPTRMSFKEVVESHGFQFEEHTCTTADGYVLKVFRIKGDGPALLLQHGFLASANMWIKYGDKESTAFKLAAAGYDVWIGNNRGNKYSPKEGDEKCYSFIELGKYDLPALIDLVHDKAGKGKLTYIGHSQGSTQIFYAMAKNQKLIQTKVELVVALAPVAHMGHVPFWYPSVSRMMMTTHKIADSLGITVSKFYNRYI